jgi:hypothetical protein
MIDRIPNRPSPSPMPVEPPGVGEQLLARQHLVGVAAEHLGQGELAGRQVDGAVGDVGSAGAQVEGELAHPEHGRLRCPVAAAAQPHPGQDLLERERLGDVVVGAALQAGHGVADAVAGGEDDHRDVDPGLAEPPEHGEPVHLGQSDVEDEQVELAAAGVVVGGLPVGHRGRGEAVAAQPLLEEGRDPPLVLGDEHAVHRAASRRAAGRRRGRPAHGRAARG